ncbi:MAG: cytochrome c maturation protein CcmE [Armatimonadota bacterium]|nr:cytochrome c maturation protein CcmE [Armatimonadota bacterium]MDR7518060.1 cytochrome c maturation protein CcmE [Armatimonadota bacterium]MDR7550479.1 cytochrome c maturation protein CcmE [Armatimonadota bacterium]
MSPTKRKLLVGSLVIVAALGFVAYQGVRSSMVYYLTPTEFKNRPDLAHQKIRMAGEVVPGSVQRSGGTVRFTITDGTTPYAVSYEGPLPDLFAEGRQVLVEGRLDRQGMLVASQVISTHPSEYREKHPDRQP